MALRLYIQKSSSGVKNLTCKAAYGMTRQGMGRQGKARQDETQQGIVCIPKKNITISTLRWISAFITWSIFILFLFPVLYRFLLLLFIMTKTKTGYLL